MLRSVSFSTESDMEEVIAILSKVAIGPILIDVHQSNSPSPVKDSKGASRQLVYTKNKYGVDTIDIEASLKKLGMTRAELLRTKCKMGSAASRIKLAIHRSKEKS